jgi:hypothetical protein
MAVNRVDDWELLGLAIERVHLRVTETEASHFECRDRESEHGPMPRYAKTAMRRYRKTRCQWETPGVKDW